MADRTPSPPDPDPLLTIGEVADRFGVHVETVRSWARRGSGPARLRLAGGTVRYKRSAVEAWIDQQVQPASGSGVG